jgi:hypothetical protein
MTNGNSAERDQFERWTHTQTKHYILRRLDNDEYFNLETRLAWSAWKARAELSVCADGDKDSSDHKFKNFHRLLCERFGYVHDEVDWKRDQISLIEWIAKRVADGGKGEAVYQYKVRDLSGWHDCDAGAYERITTNMPEHVEARTLFTAPQAECAPREAQPDGWIRMDHLRQAQQAPFLCRVEPSFRPGFDLVPVYLAAPTPERAAPPYSAPFTTDVPQCCGDPETCDDPCTPERAQESAGVRLTDAEREAIEYALNVCKQFGESGAVAERNSATLRAILAANKEPQP